jgi:hypothetical protein
VPDAWPVSVPPVTTREHPLALRRVRMPSIVDWRIPLNEVHTARVRSVQLPLACRVMPAASSCLTAWAWVNRASDPAAEAPVVAPTSRPRAVAAERTSKAGIRNKDMSARLRRFHE